MNATISLRDYIDKGKVFTIPDYQRGYVWGRCKTGDVKKDSVSYMLDSLTEGFRKQSVVFIQGVTVSETATDIILIDGQQRTTFFYLLLKYLNYTGEMKMSYDIRSESNTFLAALSPLEDYKEPDATEKYQDIFFFKKTLYLIHNRLRGEDFNMVEFRDYVLDHVKFLYIDIPADRATTVFTMMNGNKAEMKPVELIKAELLRLASLNAADFDFKEAKEQGAIEWDNNMLRSRYAREWDKWLQWWNREEVSNFFKTDSAVMGLLISTYQRLRKNYLSFANFKSEFLIRQKPIEAKRTFDGLRRLQKRFEDAFNNAIIYNKVGAIIRVCNDKPAFIQWYFGGAPSTMPDSDKYALGTMPDSDELDRYYKWSFLGLTHKEIIDKNGETFEKKFELIYNVLGSDSLYIDNAEEAFRLLLRLNIDEDNRQNGEKGRRFDFSIWDRKDSRGRSLEHIYPKSKVWHEEGQPAKKIKGNGDELVGEPDLSYINRASCKDNIDGKEIIASEHSIGNLVLLYKDDNSTFNNSSFEEKKNLFFKIHGSNKEARAIFKSRHLLHTIYKFANSEWNGREIAQNKYYTLKDFKKYYGKQD